MPLAYLLFWLKQPIDSQAMPVVIGSVIEKWLGVEIWTKRSVWLLEKGAERKKKPKQMIRFRTGGDTRDSDLEELKERWSDKASLPIFPACVSQEMLLKVEDSGETVSWKRKAKSARSCDELGMEFRSRRDKVAGSPFQSCRWHWELNLVLLRKRWRSTIILAPSLNRFDHE